MHHFKRPVNSITSTRQIYLRQEAAPLDITALTLAVKAVSWYRESLLILNPSGWRRISESALTKKWNMHQTLPNYTSVWHYNAFDKCASAYRNQIHVLWSIPKDADLPERVPFAAFLRRRSFSLSHRRVGVLGSERTHSQQMNHAPYFRSIFTVVIWRIAALDISSVKLQRDWILQEKERAEVMKDKHHVTGLFECNKSSGGEPGERRLRTALPYYISYLLSRASHSERLK